MPPMQEYSRETSLVVLDSCAAAVRHERENNPTRHTRLRISCSSSKLRLAGVSWTLSVFQAGGMPGASRQHHLFLRCKTWLQGCPDHCTQYFRRKPHSRREWTREKFGQQYRAFARELSSGF